MRESGGERESLPKSSRIDQQDFIRAYLNQDPTKSNESNSDDLKTKHREKIANKPRCANKANRQQTERENREQSKSICSGNFE